MKKGCRWKGCLFGCLGVFIAFLLFMGLSSYWLVKKGDYTPLKSMLFPDTDFYVHSEIKREDEQVIEFLVTQLQRINQDQVSMVQQSLPFLNSIKISGKKARSDVYKLLPLQIEASGNLESDDLVMAVGFSIYNNMARIGFWFLKRGARSEVDGVYQEVGDKVFIKPSANNDFFLALENSVIYLAKTEAGMQRVLDPAVVSAQMEETHPSLTQVDQTAPIWGMVRGNSLSHFFRYAPGGGADRLEHVEGGVRLGEATMRALAFDVVAENTETLRVRFFCDVSLVNPETENILLQVLEGWLENSQITIDSQVDTMLNGYMVTLRLSDFDRVNVRSINLD